MQQDQNSPDFPRQEGPEKLGDKDVSKQKEKYIRDSGKIEDLPENAMKDKKDKPASLDALTDRSGEEKKEEYINTDERLEDINKKTKK